jgi:hypothetical protein
VDSLFRFSVLLVNGVAEPSATTGKLKQPISKAIE